MNRKIKIVFIAIWILTLVFFTIEVISGFALRWMIISMNYLYVVSLVCLFTGRRFFQEKINSTETLVDFRAYDIWGLLLTVAGISGVLLFIGIKSSVVFIMATASFILSILVLIRYKKHITKSLIRNGLIVGAICSVALYSYIPSLIIVFLLLPVFFVSASILTDRFRVTTIHFNRHAFSDMVRSFVMGTLFGLPMALSNVSDVISTNPYKWIDQFWQPILALNMVILEETWVRLFIFTFIYALLISKTTIKIIPILAALIISSLIFGFSHYPQVDVNNCINISVLYGIPLGLLLYKRDFETVIGYHFIINFIGAVSAFTINNG